MAKVNSKSRRWMKPQSTVYRPQMQDFVRKGVSAGMFGKSFFVDRGPHSKYIWWVGNQDYMHYRNVALIDRVGGTVIGHSGTWTIKGLVMATSNFFYPLSDNYKICYIAHGTSNKGQGPAWGPAGKTKYDYYFLMGPKMLWAYKKYGHKINGKRGVKVGNLVADDFLKQNPEDLSKVTRAVLDIQNNKPIMLVAPTFGTMGVDRCLGALEPFKEQYNIVVTTHPKEVINEQAMIQLRSWVTFYQGNIHDILYGCDFYVGDTSSTSYDWCVTGRPMMLLEPIVGTDFWDPDKWNLPKHAVMFRPETDNVYLKYQQALEPKWGEEQKRLYKEAFYHPFEGNAAGRACDWILDTVKKNWL